MNPRLLTPAQSSPAHFSLSHLYILSLEAEAHHGVTLGKWLPSDYICLHLCKQMGYGAPAGTLSGGWEGFWVFPGWIIKIKSTFPTSTCIHQPTPSRPWGPYSNADLMSALLGSCWGPHRGSKTLYCDLFRLLASLCVVILKYAPHTVNYPLVESPIVGFSCSRCQASIPSRNQTSPVSAFN